MEKFESLKNLIVENIGCSAEEINLETKLVEDLGVDSLDIVEISMAIEEEFGVSIADDDLEKIKTVKDILELI